MKKCTFTQTPVYRGSWVASWCVQVQCGFGVHEFDVSGPVNVEQVCRMLNFRLADLGADADNFYPRDFEKN